MRALIGRLPQTRDLAIAVLLFVVVLLMILPMPTPVVDLLIGLNFGIAVLLLMTGIYLASPLALSSLPGIILISTIFRLALSITTTRLILAEGDAGRIVETFGSVVVAGNVVVGMVVFFIITIVQFIVIAKGAERIAEVGARFTLDALPGKQMAIDAELRNGDIDNVEAGARRKLLERESQFYGAMDGAMKFVKGDAIAGLIVIFVNLIGGLLIGLVQLGMPLGEALQKYSLLTVGDALISQIPALLVAITAAIIVTRVKGESERNLGADIVGQVLSDPRALRLAGAALIGMGLLPGFPTALLVALGTLFVGASVARDVHARAARRSEAEAEMEVEAAPEAPALPPLLPVEEAQAVVELAPDLFDAFAEGELRSRLDALADRVSAASGLDPCTLTALRADAMEAGRFRLLIDGAPVMWSAVADGALSLAGGAEVLTLNDVPHRAAPVIGVPTRLEVDPDHADRLDEIGLPWRPPHDEALTQVEEVLSRNLSLLVGLQETREILSAVEADYPVLVAEVLRLTSVQRVSEVLRRLLQERVPIANKRRILEAVVEWAPVDNGALALTEYARIALRQELCDAASDTARTITAVVIKRDSEDVLRAALRETNIGTFLVLDEAQTAELLGVVRRQIDLMTPKGIAPVLMTSMDVRRHLRVFLERNGIDLDVLSFQELSDDYRVVPCATLSLPSAKAAPRPRAAPVADRVETDVPPSAIPVAAS